MIWIRLDTGDDQADALMPAIVALREGGVVAFPTETFYGLAVDPRSAAAVRKLISLKGRPAHQPLPLIAADRRQVVTQVGTLSPLAERLAARGWPGPLTLIIPASGTLSPEVHLGTGRVAVRVPDSAVARAISRHAGHPITSTSANVSGQPPACTAEDAAAPFADGIDVMVDGGETPGGLPSTIVDTDGSDPVLVRAGAVPWDRVLEFLH